MKIALIGYGKMGRLIAAEAQALGHDIVLIADPFSEGASCRASGPDLARAVADSAAEGAIEFSRPDAAPGNIKALLPLRIPLVVGTTGWAAAEADIERSAAETGGTVLRSANFSVGVHLFYYIITKAAEIVNATAAADYDCAVWEAHHNKKLDIPSGTAAEIAARIAAAGIPLPKISATRVGAVPGTHTVFFDSSVDTIELTHTARSRDGFALGAIRSLERLAEKLKTGKLKSGAVYGLEAVF